MSKSRLGVGFIGAGAVTQAIHLPTLGRLTLDFEVRQVFDVAADVASSVAARVGASRDDVAGAAAGRRDRRGRGRLQPAPSACEPGDRGLPGGQAGRAV